MKSAWQRIEAGYYRLRGTDITIANMQGQSVLYSGLVLDPWHVRVGGKKVNSAASLVEAKQIALSIKGH